MAELAIGVWVRRPGKRSKYHFVESVVAEDAITRCGRRMDRVIRSGGELAVFEVMPLTRAIGQPQNCKRCFGKPNADDDARARLVLDTEDDGSTALVEDTP